MTVGPSHCDYFYFNAGLLRLITLILGATCIYMTYCGYPNNPPSYVRWKNHTVPMKAAQVTEYGYGGYHYGVGYSAEPLNQVFFHTVIATFLFSFGWVAFLLFFKGAYRKQGIKKANRSSFLVAGLLLMCGLICSIYGLIVFRSRCCHISLDNRITSEIGSGYIEPCRCRIHFDWDDDIGKDVYRFEEGTLPPNHQVSWTIPHDFYVNIAARSIALVNSIIYFICFRHY